jgi:hypothetical protein
MPRFLRSHHYHHHHLDLAGAERTEERPTPDLACPQRRGTGCKGVEVTVAQGGVEAFGGKRKERATTAVAPRLAPPLLLATS